MNIFLYLGLTFTIFCGIALLMAPMLLKPAPEVQRVLDVSSTGTGRGRRAIFAEGDELREKLLKIAQALRSKLRRGDHPELNRRLAAAGMRDGDATDLFFAAQLFTPLVLALAGGFIKQHTLLWAPALAVAGYMVPGFWLTMRQSKRRDRIRRSMPDAMDLLMICVDAGLGMDQALLRAGSELALSHPEISQEFAQVNRAQRAGQARLEAWQGLADRIKIEEFRSFVSMLAQTDRFGTPISKALGRFSEDLRLQRRQRAEEAAAKTKIKILFPLVLCIFPCIFIVLLAPAILIVAGGMKGLGN